MGRLTGKVALVTGAARGMGEFHARRFIAEGAKVIMTDVRVELGSKVAAELGPNALFLEHDVSDSASWDKVVSKGVAAFGNITVLVNNAGILGPIAKTADLTEDDS